MSRNTTDVRVDLPDFLPDLVAVLGGEGGGGAGAVGLPTSVTSSTPSTSDYSVLILKKKLIKVTGQAQLPLVAKCTLRPQYNALLFTFLRFFSLLIKTCSDRFRFKFKRVIGEPSRGGGGGGSEALKKFKS